MKLKLDAYFTKEQNEGYRAGLADAISYITRRQELELDIEPEEMVDYLNRLNETCLLGD